ncbi:hypothetical protein MSNKSG1_13292 [Marinobacter santoriniensis NKSG1]|uniref:ImpA N-terminal domain-containing protein n=1 Tax=Marinobacter santoriniensis NKSG1 TaxID=1288826 RepID=M7CS19_9GAMM|nr:type VI secretion system protein TssA [Marinobacter santoriniensis]EMP54910.1 hypothetical protein MSNKSG1_13292 [Marinobacter santoriniensis NKSG1]
MQIIVQHPYVEQVLEPIAGEDGVGEALEEDATLEFLEDEIMKVGSLAHNDIDWPKVESEALKLLADRSKHLKVFGFLLLALQRGGNGERFALSLYLLHRVLDSWWTQAWPYPGEKGKRARRMIFTQMLQRAEKGVGCLSFDGGAGDGRSYCLGLLSALVGQAERQGLPDELLLDIKRSIEKLETVGASGAGGTEPQIAATNSSAARSREAESRPVPTASLGQLTLDPGDERATRQSLLKVAELLTASEPDSPLGYRMRRYAIWLGVTSAPPSRDGKRTDLAAVSGDRVAEYRETLERAPDLSLWQRVEQSLSVSPFWLDGHWLSARIASALGNEPCAEAIREALREFVERLPQIPELAFNDGTPFLGEEAAGWLWASPSTGSTGGADANPWDKAYEQARELLSQNALNDAMQLMEQGLSDAREPRERFYWRLSNARILRDAGMASLAAHQIEDMRHQIQGRVLEEWEPGLIKVLERLT